MFSASGFTLTKEIVDTIEPFKVGSEFLCNRCCNLNEAEETVKFISEKLTVQTDDGQLATELLERLKDRYSNRSSKYTVSLVKFFENPDSLSVLSSP